MSSRQLLRELMEGTSLCSKLQAMCNTVRNAAIEIGVSETSSRFLSRRGKSGEPAANFYNREIDQKFSALRAHPVGGVEKHRVWLQGSVRVYQGWVISSVEYDFLGRW